MDGEVLSETEYRNTIVRSVQREAIIDLFAQAVVDKAVEIERNRQSAIRQNLEGMWKIQRVRRMRVSMILSLK